MPVAENVVTVDVADVGLVITDVPGLVANADQDPVPVAAIVALPVW